MGLVGGSGLTMSEGRAKVLEEDDLDKRVVMMGDV